MLRRRLLQGAAALGLIPFLPKLVEGLNIVGEASVSGTPPHMDLWFMSYSEGDTRNHLRENLVKEMKKHYGNRPIYTAKLPEVPSLSCNIFRDKEGFWVRRTIQYDVNAKKCVAKWEIAFLNLTPV